MIRVSIRTWQRARTAIAGAVVLLLATGCATGQFTRTGGSLARSALDSLLGFPAISVVVGANDVLDAGNENAHEQRVEELNSAYAEFVNDRHRSEPGNNDPSSSVVTRSDLPPDRAYESIYLAPAILD
jgi:hypothetical protein